MKNLAILGCPSMLLDISTQIHQNPDGYHYGIAVVDIDHDGQFEFFITNFDGPNRVLKWHQDRLIDVTPLALADPERRAISAVGADLDGDGHEELYILNTDTYSGPKNFPDRMWKKETSGIWTDLFSLPQNRAVQNEMAGRSVAVLDRRGTGRYGFFVANYGRPMRYYELQSDRQLIDMAPALDLNLTTGGRGLWVGPLTSERPDIVCVNEHGINFVFRNTGCGTFLEIASELKLADGEEHGRGVFALDADDDGRLDLVYGNWNGPHRLMIREPDGTFRDRAAPALALPSSIRNVLAADFDNDGYEELFFNNIDEPNRLFRYEARKDQAAAWRLADPGDALEPTGLGTGAAIADIDNDGQLELLIAHGESSAQPLSLYKAKPSAHGWLRVMPLTRFGAPARGALVRLNFGERSCVRVIDGGSGYLCQMEPVAHFGLGNSGAVESVRIVWPDGASQMIENPPIRHTLKVPYPER